MKLDILEAHDRYQELSKRGINISACCQSLIDQRPFGDYPFYIFAHMRTEENGIDKRLIWQPRLTKPKAQTNSMLFKGYPGTDKVKVIWMIPDRSLWGNFEYGNLCHNQTVAESIYDFMFNRGKLEVKEEDDLSDETIDQIYREISVQGKHTKSNEEAYEMLKDQPALKKMMKSLADS